MVSERDRSIKLANYIKSLGVDVNIYKNNARGNRGFFSVKDGKYRIDISKKLSDKDLFEVLIHEFAHYIHYRYDKNLKNLDFIFNDYDNIENELIELTVCSIPKDEAKALFMQKEKINNDINVLTRKIKNEYPNFSKSKNIVELDKLVNKTALKYFLKHDRIKVVDFFSIKLYDINKLEIDFKDEKEVLKSYVLLKSKQRMLKRINSKINRLNKYFNSPTELFARAFSLYITQRNLLEKKAPKTLKEFDNAVNNNKITLINQLIEIF